MFKKPLALIVYTLFIIVVSSLITTAYIHYFVMGAHSDDDVPALTFISDEQIKNSPLTDENTIVEIFSYGCHYCAVNENNVKDLEAQLPPAASWSVCISATRKTAACPPMRRCSPRCR
ncbi:Uncharacterised protein [Serratia rubidaea]|uniref:Thiol:disulfide interchange protein DsbA n=1 Tax=Serratia rubidaea TaxID=61652 RepID=A0A4V6JI24_SERRU|nr:Uncharacterised protein [Serratia rubidaea]